MSIVTFFGISSLDVLPIEVSFSFVRISGTGGVLPGEKLEKRWIASRFSGSLSSDASLFSSYSSMCLLGLWSEGFSRVFCSVHRLLGQPILSLAGGVVC